MKLRPLQRPCSPRGVWGEQKLHPQFRLCGLDREGRAALDTGHTQGREGQNRDWSVGRETTWRASLLFWNLQKVYQCEAGRGAGSDRTHVTGQSACPGPAVCRSVFSPPTPNFLLGELAAYFRELEIQSRP